MGTASPTDIGYWMFFPHATSEVFLPENNEH